MSTRHRSRSARRSVRALSLAHLLYAPIPPPPAWTAPPPPPMSTAPFAPTPERSRRTITPEEYAVLAQDFKQQKGKMIILPILGIFASILLISLDDWTMSPLILFSLLSPVVVVALRKYRDAIVAGSVVEYRGVPTAVASETRNSKPFYQIRLGNEPLSVPPTLFARLVPNVPNTLAVFERAKGQAVAISLNGTALPAPLKETVVTMTPSAGPSAPGPVWAVQGGKR